MGSLDGVDFSTMSSSLQPVASSLFARALRFLLIVAVIQFLAAALVLAPRLVSTVAGQLASKTKVPVALMPLSNKENEAMALNPKNQEDGLKSKITSASLTDRASHQDISSLPERRDMAKTISSPKDANAQHGTTLALISVQHSLGNEGEHVLKIAIKSQSHESISIPDVKVQVYFYDEVDGEIVASKSPVASRWLSLPIDWKDADPQLLEVTYQPENNNAAARYVGYIVAIYYKGELQGYRVDPPSLTNQFPIKVYIPFSSEF